ncbi:hypothetical protein FQR65_LT01349 [Abscondita terminalis]|nr:hypothetical protein FQR65_LT01349 [Abscondita terminalis]
MDRCPADEVPVIAGTRNKDRSWTLNVGQRVALASSTSQAWAISRVNAFHLVGCLLDDRDEPTLIVVVHQPKTMERYIWTGSILASVTLKVVVLTVVLLAGVVAVSILLTGVGI